MYDNIVTDDIAQFGARERYMLKEILEAWDKHGLPDNFSQDNVKPMFNKNSGFVFLTNDEYQTCLLNGDKLELWHNCAYCGHEGFLEDFEHTPVDPDCIEQMKWAGVEINDNEG